MKFPTLFGKTPRHQRFTFEPRYFDPKKEEMAEREARIRQEQEAVKKENDGTYRSRIAGSFKVASKRAQTQKGDLNTSLLRLGILLFMVLMIIAYLTWGNAAFYGFLLFIPLYVYFKLKK